MRTRNHTGFFRSVIAGCLVAASLFASAQTPSLTGPSVPEISLTPAGMIAGVSAPRISLADEPASCGTAAGGVVSVTHALRMAGLRVYPNPLGHWTNVELPETDRASELHLMNQLGQRVWSRTYPPGAGNPVTLQLPHLPPGVYMLRWLVKGEVRAAGRVVKVGG